MNRTNRILLILLIVQLGIVLLAHNPWSESEYSTGSGDAQGSLLFPEFDPDATVAIEIVQGNRSLMLRRSESASGETGQLETGQRETGQRETFVRETDVLDTGEWQVSLGSEPAMAADPFKIRAFFDSISSLAKQEIASRSEKKREVFGVDVGSALHVVVRGRGNQVLAELTVGRHLGPLRGTYVSLPGAAEIYRVRENIRHACLGKDDDWLSFWRDNALLSLDTAAIVSIEVTAAGRAFVVRRVAPAVDGETEWEIEARDPAQKSLDIERIRRILVLLASVRAQGNAPSGASLENLGLAEPEIEITLKLDSAASSATTLRLSRQDGGFRYLMVNGDAERIYKVHSYPFHIFLEAAE